MTKDTRDLTPPHSRLSDQQWLLLDRYVAGELCDEDKAQLERVADQDPALRQLLQSMRRVGHRWSDGRWEVSDGWKAMTLRMATLGSRPIARLVSPETTNDRPTVERDDLLFSSRRGQRQGVARVFRDRWWPNVWGQRVGGALVVGAALIIGFLALDNRYQQARVAGTMNELTTTASQRTSVRLVDGTLVTMGPQTKLRIPSDFDKSRDVYLQGEALFEVTTQSPKPFIVHTKHAAVRVLGTTFDVRAHENLKRVEVAVVQGKVSLASSHGTSPTTIVSADYLGTIYPDGETRVEQVSLEPYTAWVGSRLVYQNTPLREVVADIARWYNVQVVFDRIATDRRRLIAEWDTQSLEHVLHSLSLVLNARYEYRNGQVIFSPREESR